jgi:hypothetical protein
LSQQENAKHHSQIAGDAERIRSSIGRRTLSSINELKSLNSELQDLQEFLLKSEVERVEREIESALAGINIIIETIAPWKGISEPMMTPGSARGVRGGPAANIPSGSRLPD